MPILTNINFPTSRVNTVFGNNATPKLKDLKILLPANDQSKKPVQMKHTDRHTYLGLEFHEMDAWRV